MPELISAQRDPDVDFWGLPWMVTLPNLGREISHARMRWCEARWGSSWHGLWNHWDYDSQYVFHRLDDAVLFELTWG